MFGINKRSNHLGLLFVVGGPGGSGASTIARMLADHFSLRYVYGGKLMREFARENGFDSLTEFLQSNLFKKNSKSYDFFVDEHLLEKSFSKDTLIDSKIFAGLAARLEIPCTVKIWIDADLGVRVSRTLGKKGFEDLSIQNPEYPKIEKRLIRRYQEDKNRFLKLYKVEFDKQEKYNDIVIDSSNQNPDETFNFLLKLIKDGGYFERN